MATFLEIDSLFIQLVYFILQILKYFFICQHEIDPKDKKMTFRRTNSSTWLSFP